VPSLPLWLRPKARDADVALGVAGGQVARGVQHRQHRHHVAGGQRRHRRDLLLHLRRGVGHLLDQRLVAHEADRPADDQQQRQQREQRVGRQRDAAAALLDDGAAPADVGLGEDDAAQQVREEVAAARRGGRRQHLALEAVGTRDVAQHAIKRAALLGAAGEVDTAHHRLLAEGRAEEGLVEERLEHLAQRRELLREREQRGPALRVALFFHTRGQARVQARDQRVELGGEGGAQAGAGGHGEVERGAPHLRARLAPEVAEELGEAGQQVGLGDDHVDREAHAQRAVELLHAGPDRARVLVALRGRPGEQVGQAHRDDGAVERLRRPELLQQREEARPRGGVDLAVAALGGVAAGGIEQHGLVGEPPVAVARAADALDGILAHLALERKAQARVHQRRGLAGAGRADEHVPGQLVEVVAAAAGLVVEARLAQRAHRVVEALLELGHLALRHRAVAGGALAHRRQHRLVGAPGAVLLDALDDREEQDDEQDQADSRAGRPERTMVIERDGVADEPDQQRHDQQADEREHPPIGEETLELCPHVFCYPSLTRQCAG